VNDTKPLQIVESIVPDFEGEVDYPLIAAKFGSVDTLILLITGMEDDLMQISALGFKGEPRGFTKKPVEGITYEIRAQLKDHKTTRADRAGNTDIA